MSRLLDLSSGITRSWTATYTRGLPHDLRAERREEIDSDLWDHRRLANIEREPANGTAVQILARFALGIPADLLWRIEAGNQTNNNRRTIVNEALYMRGIAGIGILLGLFITATGIMAAVDIFDDGDGSPWLVGGSLTALSGIALIAGLLINRRNPPLGIGLVVAAVITIVAVWNWVMVITIPVGITLIGIALVRALGTGWPSRSTPGAA